MHSRNIDNIFKLNYLLDALQGEAKESVKQFEISDSTYPLVIEHLKEKYGDRQALVDQLLNKLHTTRARSSDLQAQELLCEQLYTITSQLQVKGEHIDNSFLQKQLLNKFSTDVQRHILRQKVRNEHEGTWDTIMLLTTAKEYVKSELRIARQIQRGSGDAQKRNKEEAAPTTKKGNQERYRSSPCFYCKIEGHKPRYCPEASTTDQRLQIMKTRKLCQNCGGKDHTTATCQRGACRICKEVGHHTSICRSPSAQLQRHRQQPKHRKSRQPM